MERPHMRSITLDDTPRVGLPRLLDINDPNAAGSLVYQRVRRQVVARGLARHHGGARSKEGHQKARMMRLQKQLAIIDEYRREQRVKEEITNSDDRKESQSFANVVPAVPAAPFSRKVRLHQLGSGPSFYHSVNQLDDQSHQPRPFPVAFPSPQGSKEIMDPSSRRQGPQTNHIPSQASHKLSSKVEEDKTTSRATPDKTVAQVMCELKITKGIMMREHLVEEIHDTVTVLDGLSKELHDMSTKRADDDKVGVKPGSLTKRPSKTSLASSPHTISTSSKQQKKGNNMEIEAIDMDCEEDVQFLDARQNDCGQMAQQRMMQLRRLIVRHQVTSVELVESILEWRKHKTKRGVVSNMHRHHRFAWRKCHIENYLAHMDSDLRDLFPSAGLYILLGLNARYNPLLLSRSAMDMLGVPEDAFVSTTFLTERRERDTDNFSHEASFPTKRQSYVALHNAVKDIEMMICPEGTDLQTYPDPDRLRRCLEAIRHECELETAFSEAQASEKIRLESAYNPFESIKEAGGVEDTIASVVGRQSLSDSFALSEQLRHRQEDAHRENASPHGGSNKPGHATGVTSLHVNPVRIRRLIDQRKEVKEASTECELVDAVTSWKKNKLRGQVIVRKMNVRRVENQHARKIQRQFETYRRRTQLLKNLAHLAIISRQRIVSIQKLVRGFLAKKRYNEERERVDFERRLHSAAKKIWYTYKRFKRRQRHRHSMSVEAVAQIQLLQVIQHQLEDVAANETSSAERYRRLGEERRRLHAVHLLKRRQEMLEIEAKRLTAAVRIQSIIRMHLAKGLAFSLRSERRAYLSAVSAMMIQSKIRKFLKRQEGRRQRFRSDLERVNRSAVRIQSIYRGYNSRASLVVELDESLRRKLSLFNQQASVDENEDEEEEGADYSRPGDVVSAKDDSSHSDYFTLPPIAISRPLSGSVAANAMPVFVDADDIDGDDNSSMPIENLHVMVARLSPPKVSLPPLRHRAASVQTNARKAQPPPVRRQTSSGTVKVELKLKETTLGDDLDSASIANANSGFLGPLRRRLSGTGNGSFKSPLHIQEHGGSES